MKNPHATLPGPYDVAYSLIVLQHNRPELMKVCIRNLLQGLRSGGLAVLHIPYHMKTSGQSKDPLVMEMNFLPLHEIQSIGAPNQCELIDTTHIDFCGPGIQNAIFTWRKA